MSKNKYKIRNKNKNKTQISEFYWNIKPASLGLNGFALPYGTLPTALQILSLLLSCLTAVVPSDACKRPQLSSFPPSSWYYFVRGFIFSVNKRCNTRRVIFPNVVMQNASSEHNCAYVFRFLKHARHEASMRQNAKCILHYSSTSGETIVEDALIPCEILQRIRLHEPCFEWEGIISDNMIMHWLERSYTPGRGLGVGKFKVPSSMHFLREEFANIPPSEQLGKNSQERAFYCYSRSKPALTAHINVEKVVIRVN